MVDVQSHRRIRYTLDYRCNRGAWILKHDNVAGLIQTPFRIAFFYILFAPLLTPSYKEHTSHNTPHRERRQQIFPPDWWVQGSNRYTASRYDILTMMHSTNSHLMHKHSVRLQIEPKSENTLAINISDADEAKDGPRLH